MIKGLIRSSVLTLIVDNLVKRTHRSQYPYWPASLSASNELCPRESEVLLLDLGEVKFLPTSIGEMLGDYQDADSRLGKP